MAFTESEKERVRYHLGYGSTNPSTALSLGLPVTVAPLFVVEASLGAQPVDAEERVRRILQKLDDLDCKIFEAADYLVAEQLGDLRPRENACDLLEREYVRWAERLADALRVPIYPYSTRFSRRRGAGNVPVSG